MGGWMGVARPLYIVVMVAPMEARQKEMERMESLRKVLQEYALNEVQRREIQVFEAGNVSCQNGDPSRGPGDGDQDREVLPEFHPKLG
jgi:hypothetical protein